MSDGYSPGEGCILQLEMGTTPTFTSVANITSLSLPTMTVGEVEYTNVLSVKKRYRPSRIPESGTVSGECNYDPAEATHNEILALIKTPELRNWKIILKDGTTTLETHAFSGFLTSFNPSGIADASNLTASFSIRVDGDITTT